MRAILIKYCLLFSIVMYESCFFGPATFKDVRNYLLTDPMAIVNTSRKEKITGIKIYVDSVPLFTGRNLILDTVFSPSVDTFLIPFNKDSLNSKYVDIYIELSSPPGLSISTIPGALTKKRKILFEGDKY